MTYLISLLLVSISFYGLGQIFSGLAVKTLEEEEVCASCNNDRTDNVQD